MPECVGVGVGDKLVTAVNCRDAAMMLSSVFGSPERTRHRHAPGCMRKRCGDVRIVTGSTGAGQDEQGANSRWTVPSKSLYKLCTNAGLGPCTPRPCATPDSCATPYSTLRATRSIARHSTRHRTRLASWARALPSPQPWLASACCAARCGFCMIGSASARLSRTPRFVCDSGRVQGDWKRRGPRAPRPRRAAQLQKP